MLSSLIQVTVVPAGISIAFGRNWNVLIAAVSVAAVAAATCTGVAAWSGCGTSQAPAPAASPARARPSVVWPKSMMCDMVGPPSSASGRWRPGFRHGRRDVESAELLGELHDN